jgi:hypothetical protein
MAKNTLSPVRGRNKVVTSFDPHWRMAIDDLSEELGHSTRAETLREVVIGALVAQGITEQKARAAYLKYQLECVEAGRPDQYESGEL